MLSDVVGTRPRRRVRLGLLLQVGPPRRRREHPRRLRRVESALGRAARDRLLARRRAHVVAGGGAGRRDGHQVP